MNHCRKMRGATNLPVQLKAACVLLACLLAGCADSLQGDVYTREEARKPLQVRYGRVESVTPVVIEGERGFVGQAGGGLIGGAAGSTVGGGAGRTVATAVGAVAGAVVGGVTQEKLTRAQGAEILVRFDGGETMAVVQEVRHTNEFVVGQRVKITSGSGRMRVMSLGAPN